MVEWNTTDRGQIQEDGFTTSYGEQDSDADYDGKSCSDHHQLPGRGIRDVESLTLLHGLGLREMDEADDDE